MEEKVTITTDVYIMVRALASKFSDIIGEKVEDAQVIRLAFDGFKACKEIDKDDFYYPSNVRMVGEVSEKIWKMDATLLTYLAPSKDDYDKLATLEAEYEEAALKVMELKARFEKMKALKSAEHSKSLVELAHLRHELVLMEQYIEEAL